MGAKLALAGVLLPLIAATARGARGRGPRIEPLLRTVDLRVGEQAKVTLADGKAATVKLLDVRETRGGVRNAVRQARVSVEVNGQKATLSAAFYQLPVAVGGVQIDCAVTKGCVRGSKGNAWALDADARLRLWPAGSPWIRPGTFIYPATQRWFASDTQMANEPTFVNGDERPARKNVYYHYGLDVGGAEGLVEIVAATDGLVVSRGEQVLAPHRPRVNPRYDVVYLRDGRGWYYRYSHLHSIDPAVKLGERVAMGQRVGLLGKEGGSGGWSHLHFDIKAPQPSGRYGIVEAYAFFWQACHTKHQTKLQAVARPHHLAWCGEEVVLDAGRSWSAKGQGHIASFQWILSDKTTAGGMQAKRTYKRPGTYSETLKVVDKDGRVDYDFAVVQVIDRKAPKQLPPTIHAAYFPTLAIKAGDAITFKVRSFRIGRQEGHEVWDFGDGSTPVEVQSDGNARTHAKDGYAVTTHRYSKLGHYLVAVSRANARGETATARLHVRVEASKEN